VFDESGAEGPERGRLLIFLRLSFRYSAGPKTQARIFVFRYGFLIFFFDFVSVGFRAYDNFITTQFVRLVSSKKKKKKNYNI